MVLFGIIAMGEAIDLYHILHFVSKYKWFVHAVCFIFRHGVCFQDCCSKELQPGASDNRSCSLWSWLQQSEAQVWARPCLPRLQGGSLPGLPPLPLAVASNPWRSSALSVSLQSPSPFSHGIHWPVYHQTSLFL